MQKERNMYLDILKAVSIILVVIGHCIQYGSGMQYLTYGTCLYNPVFIFIYSFHMPLFMLISGFLFSYSLKNKTTKGILFSKIKQIIIPLACWSFIATIIQTVKALTGVSSSQVSFIWICQTLLSSFWGGPWFLWALWWCSLCVILGKKLFKDNAIYYVILLIITFVTPDKNNIALYKFMFPFFLLGYIFNHYDLKTKLKKIYTHKAFEFSCLIIFILLLKHYDFNSYIYTSGYTLLNKDVLFQLHNDFFRFFIGIFGSVSIMCIVHAFFQIAPKIVNKVFAYVGACSLGIYIISNYLFDEVLKWLPINGLNYWYTLIEVICVLLITIGITTLLKKIKITNKLFLGGR